MTHAIETFLSEWIHDPKKVKPGLVRFIKAVSAVPGAGIELVFRPGVTHSLRATHPACAPRPLFALADVIEDPDGRWLSTCFYAETVTDPEERGNLVPGGLLGEDGYCFDYEAPDGAFSDYIAARLAEAASKIAPAS